MKKGQASVIAFIRLGFAIALFFPFIFIYGAMRDYFLSFTTNVVIRLIVSAFPVFYWVGVAFIFVNTLRTGS